MLASRATRFGRRAMPSRRIVSVRAWRPALVIADSACRGSAASSCAGGFARRRTCRSSSMSGNSECADPRWRRSTRAPTTTWPSRSSPTAAGPRAGGAAAQHRDAGGAGARRRRVPHRLRRPSRPRQRAAGAADAEGIRPVRLHGAASEPGPPPQDAARRGVGRGVRRAVRSTCACSWASCARSWNPTRRIRATSSPNRGSGTGSIRPGWCSSDAARRRRNDLCRVRSGPSWLPPGRSWWR